MISVLARSAVLRAIVGLAVAETQDVHNKK
jgi:hypothetical protein